MSTSFQQFRSLHQSGELFVLPNVWNPRSAAVFQESGFAAIGTSSAAVAVSLGYSDGEQMPFSDYLFIIKRILASVNIPLTVDLEMGYGKSVDDIYANCRQLVELGVAGINIEDSSIDQQGRKLKDAASFADMIQQLKAKLRTSKQDLFINIRCDTYILGVPDKQQETIQRLERYEPTGADGIFLPCIIAEDDIADAVRATKLPVNVMCIPGLPGFDTLNRLGVKRVSMGPFLFNKTYELAGKLAKEVMNDRSFSPLFS
jgi:2-methylisocitrate lyase-like PEP mutase family enzyme